MEGVTINFNMDTAKLLKLGVDVTTSEGKAQMRQLILRAAHDGLHVERGGLEGEEEQKVKCLFDDNVQELYE